MAVTWLCECFGLLISYRDRRGPEDMYIVEHACPTNRRGAAQRASSPRTSASRGSLSSIPHLSVIGDFHSHTMWGYNRAASRPSDTDLAGMTKENVYVIVSINDRLREVAWNYNDDGSLSGTTDDHYFRLTAYTVTAAAEPRRTTVLSARTPSASTPAGSCAPSSSGGHGPGPNV